MSRYQMDIRNDNDKRLAIQYIEKARDRFRVEFSRPKRSDEQNRLLWACLGEMSVQLKWHGQHITAEDWKLVFMDALSRELKQDIRIVPNTDNNGFVNLGRSSSRLSKDEMSLLITLIIKFGTEHGVVFHDPGAATYAPAAGGEELSSRPSSPASHSKGASA